MPAKINLTQTRDLLREFAFGKLFIESLGWEQPATARASEITVDGRKFTLRHLAKLAGIAAIEVRSDDGGIPDAKTRADIHAKVRREFHENVLIFVDANDTLSVWYWVKRENGKRFARDHYYAKGQPGDLFLSKIAAMAVDISELDDEGKVSLVDAAKRVSNALDVETVTKKFYNDFKDERLSFVEHISGIDDERERRWYASVLLNRLMFIYFLQRKGFIDQGDLDYLQRKLGESRRRGANRFYTEFLAALFFEGFAKPPGERSDAARALIGTVTYLNGGLFLPHQIEQRYAGKIDVDDSAFENLFALFARYSWNLNDTPGADDNEISPDVLGYIFEKYINQKEFGAYYTRPEITNYLCQQTIHRLILDKLNPPATAGDVAGIQRFDDIRDLLTNLDGALCHKLLFSILPELSILDPACGSGAFLVAAMKTLIDFYSAVIGKIPFLSDKKLRDWEEAVKRDHPSAGYYIKKKIITENLYGVDIMAEGAEIARLRLFLALVSSAQTVEQLEPLPNIDFNILHGNSLIGLLKIDPSNANLFGSYADEVAERNRLVESYRHAADNGYAEKLADKRGAIEDLREKAYGTLNDLLLEQFKGIKYEQATWDEAKNTEGKPEKRGVTLREVESLEPFHWGYEFDEIINKRGGFDAIITNPPWDVFQTDEKEFFQIYDGAIAKNKLRIEDWKRQKAELMADPVIRKAWLEYASRFPHVSAYYKTNRQYVNQISIVNGRNESGKINLYALFTEQCFNLLRTGGHAGMVLPSGLYTDLGAKQLRLMLFGQTQITGLFGFENRQSGGGMIFENVDSRFKFIVLSFRKGGKTAQFPAAFMRHDTAELERFPVTGGLPISVELIERLSPDSLSIMEFQSDIDVQIAEKMLKFPLLGERKEGTWNVKLGSEFNMTNDSHLFQTSPGPGRLPLYEGKMIHQFTSSWGKPRYWVDEKAGRRAILGRVEDTGQPLDYQGYRLGFRDIARNTDERTMIATVLPKSALAGNTLITTKSLSDDTCLIVTAILNAYVTDFSLRQKVTSHCNMFYVYQAPVPRLTASDPRFRPIVERAARLICTTPEFDDLAEEIGLAPLRYEDSPPSPLNGGAGGGNGEPAGHLMLVEGGPGYRRSAPPPGDPSLLESRPALFAPEQPALGDTFTGPGTEGQGGPRQGSAAPDTAKLRPIYGVTDPSGRAKLRAELDGMIAHLYNLTEDEFAHILTTFPLVAQSVKDDAMAEFRRQAPKAADTAIAALIAQGESRLVEFKSSARWDMAQNAPNKAMERVIVKTVAAFLNSPDGGTLLIGVADDGTPIGLEHDYRTFKQSPDQDGFDLWIHQLLVNECGGDIALLVRCSFHEHCGKTLCKLDITPASKPTWVTESGAQKFYARVGASSRELSGPEAMKYAQERWK